MFLLLGVLFGACTDEEIQRVYPLTFAQGTYEVRTGITMSIPFRSGNKSYVVASSDTAVVKASASITDSQIGFGDLYLWGNAKGQAIVSVKDRVSGEQVDLRITVTDFYLGFEVVDTDSVLFQRNDYLFFVKNKSNDFLAYEGADLTTEPVLRFKGTYDFIMSGNKPFVHITYEKDGQPVKYVFDMAESSSELLAMLDHFWGLSQKKTKDIGIHNYYMNLKETSTGSKSMCLLRDQYPLPKE